MAPVAFWSQFVLLALSHSALASPIEGSQQHVLQPPNTETLPEVKNTQQRKLHGKFLHITDFHPDPFYKVHSSTEEGIACHRQKGVAGSYGAETSDCDSPFSLVNATFDWLADNVKDEIDFVVWTGDSARHDSDEKHPRHADEVLDTNRIIADKFADTFSSGKKGLDVPVIPTWGNNDFLPHNIFYPGPNRWLHKYTDIWRRFIPEAQRHSFEFGGWFWVEVVPNHLAVFSLNTMYFFDRNAGVDGCADPREPGFKHMEWLRVQLQLMRERGMKAILIGHVPPARTDSKQNWDETCWQKYTLWMQQFRDVVTASLYGHMNIDHFLLQDTKKVDLTLGANQLSAREAMDDEISVASKEDYLQDLRKEWSDLPGSVFKPLVKDDIEAEDVEASKKKKKKKKYKKIGGKYAERYALSLISPSIVPNYFPTLRVIEYNITGLEDAALWADTFDVENAESTLPSSEEWEDDDSEDSRQELKRDIDAQGKKKKKKGKKGKKPKKPKDPHLVVPEDPPKGSTPGPAYFPQSLTLTGYTQYFANLTFINNDVTKDVKGNKWREGDHSDKEPKHKDPKPNDFKFEVEYSTFDDKVYKLKDMTVMSYLKLAYKLGLKRKVKGLGDADIWDAQTEDDLVDEMEGDDEDDEEQDSDSDSDDEVDAQKKGKKHKKKKGKKIKNKMWLSFLSRAFVSTVPEDELEEMA